MIKASDYKWDTEPTEARFTYLDQMKIVYVYPDYPAGVCVYCGEFASHKDHLLPRNWSGEADRRRVPVVPSCAECNSTFLGDIFEPDVIARREICQGKIRKKYRSALRTIQWGEEDLKEFGPQLRTVLKKQMEEHDRTMKRLAWPHEADFDHQAWRHAWEEPKVVEFKDAPDSIASIFRERLQAPVYEDLTVSV